MRRILNTIEIAGLTLFFAALWLYYPASKLKPVQGSIWLWREVRYRAWKAKGWVLTKLPRKKPVEY